MFVSFSNTVRRVILYEIIIPVVDIMNDDSNHNQSLGQTYI